VTSTSITNVVNFLYYIGEYHIAPPFITGVGIYCFGPVFSVTGTQLSRANEPTNVLSGRFTLSFAVSSTGAPDGNVLSRVNGVSGLVFYGVSINGSTIVFRHLLFPSLVEVRR
jgi:hypothetical protein